MIFSIKALQDYFFLSRLSGYIAESSTNAISKMQQVYEETIKKTFSTRTLIELNGQRTLFPKTIEIREAIFSPTSYPILTCVIRLENYTREFLGQEPILFPKRERNSTEKNDFQLLKNVLGGMQEFLQAQDFFDKKIKQSTFFFDEETKQGCLVFCYGYVLSVLQDILHPSSAKKHQEEGSTSLGFFLKEWVLFQILMNKVADIIHIQILRKFLLSHYDSEIQIKGIVIGAPEVLKERENQVLLERYNQGKEMLQEVDNLLFQALGIICVQAHAFIRKESSEKEEVNNFEDLVIMERYPSLPLISSRYWNDSDFRSKINQFIYDHSDKCFQVFLCRMKDLNHTIIFDAMHLKIYDNGQKLWETNFVTLEGMIDYFWDKYFGAGVVRSINFIEWRNRPEGTPKMISKL